MENVKILNFQRFGNTIKFIDWIYRYANLLSTHKMSPYKQMGLPLPIFVLREMAYKMKSFTSAASPLKCIVDSLKDTAYIVHAASRKGKLINTPLKYDTTFSEKDLMHIERMVAKLHKKMAVHRQLVTELQKAQQFIWRERGNLVRRTAAYSAYRQRCVRLGKDQVTRNVTVRIHIYQQKIRRSQHAHRDAQVRFQALAKKEEDTRKDLFELHDELYDVAGTAIILMINKIRRALIQAIDGADEFGSYESVKSELFCISGYMITDALLQQCSKVYQFLDAQELIKARGFLDVPAVSLVEPCDLHLSEHQLPASHMNLVAPDDCDFNNDNCYLRSTAKPGCKSDSRFLLVAPGDTIKQKLHLMEGEIVFVWSRKGLLGLKSWGFCHANSVKRVAN